MLKIRLNLRKVVAIAICLAVSATMFAQDIIILKDGTYIQASVMEIGRVDIKFKKFDNLNGPTYLLAQSEISAIQYANGNTEVFPESVKPMPTNRQQETTYYQQFSTNNNIGNNQQRFSQTTQNLSSAELMKQMHINSPDLYNRYKSANSLKNVGIGLTFGGFTLAIVGMVIADENGDVERISDTEARLTGPGAVLTAVGIISTAAGIPIWIVGSTKKKIARNNYLREFSYSEIYTPVQPSPYFQLNAIPNGLGLAFIF